jgi:hypothetical protein
MKLKDLNKYFNLKSKKRRILLAIFSIIIILTIIFIIWANSSYKGNDVKSEDLQSIFPVQIEESDNYIKVVSNDFLNAATRRSFIFYPGGRVDAKAYLTNLSRIAGGNTMRIYIVKMPLNLAVFNINGAKTIIEENTTDENDIWIIGGHSLGGSMACEFVNQNNIPNLKYLILMGSYCSSDISKKDIKVLSITGELDAFAGREKIKQYDKNLPTDKTTFKDIKGFNHSEFGTYGLQEGDNKPSLSEEESSKVLNTTIQEYFDQY